MTLHDIGIKHMTDKATFHSYCFGYEIYLARMQGKPINLLEIGVASGVSLRMWKEYFTRGNIYGIDNIKECKIWETDRIKVFIGDQTNTKFLKNVCKKIPQKLDIIIDDGSHYILDIKTSLKYLIPKLCKGGLYIVEDMNDKERIQIKKYFNGHNDMYFVNYYEGSAGQSLVIGRKIK